MDASVAHTDAAGEARRGARIARLNRVLHIMAMAQLRNATARRVYFDRKRAEGKSVIEALRCLKRRLPDVAFRQMVGDAQAAAAPESASESSSEPAPEPGVESLLEEVEGELVIELPPGVEQVLVTGPGGQVGGV